MHLVCNFIGLCEAVASSITCCASQQVQQYCNEIHKPLSKTSDCDFLNDNDKYVGYVGNHIFKRISSKHI